MLNLSPEDTQPGPEEPPLSFQPATSSVSGGSVDEQADPESAQLLQQTRKRRYRKPGLVLGALSSLAVVVISTDARGYLPFSTASSALADGPQRRLDSGRRAESKKELLERYRHWREDTHYKTERVRQSLAKERSAIAAEHKLTTGFDNLDLEGAEVNFMMPKRPHSRAKLSWGESLLPEESEFESTIEENPWIESARTWRDTGARKKQKLVVIGGLPRSGSTLLEVFFSRYEEYVSFLKFPPNNQNTMEGLDLGHWPGELLGYGGSGQFYRKMCGVDEEGKLARKTLHRTGRQKDLVDRTRKASFDAWKSWNFSKPVLVEKDPPNLLRMQLFEKVFGETHDVFPIFTLKHPLEIGSAYDCDPHSEERLEITQNWLNCHTPWIHDLKFLRNYLVVPYEAWFLNITEVVTTISRYLNLPVPHDEGRRLVLWNPSKHFKLDRTAYAPCYRSHPEKFKHIHKSLASMEKDYLKYGYDLTNSAIFKQPNSFVLCKLDGKPCSDLAL